MAFATMLKAGRLRIVILMSVAALVTISPVHTPIRHLILV